MKKRSTFRFDFSTDSTATESKAHLYIDEIHRAGMTFGRIYDFYADNLEKLDSFDAILVRFTNARYAKHLISSIRATREKFIYLLPVFLESPMDRAAVFDQLETVDGVIQGPRDLKGKFEKVKYLASRTREIRLTQFMRYDDAVLFSLLSFLYTRSIEQIGPQLDAETRVGYRYPILTDFDLITPHKVSHLSILEKAEQAGYLSGHFQYVSYVCNQCSSGFLQFREVCPACHSANIGSQEMVHHFRCAHVAPVSDFLKMEGRDRSLHCPKCDHSLKHIGVDYDKPSEIHQCHTCDHEFQYYSVRAKCTSCATDQQVEHLAKKKFKSYGMTQKAIAALKEGRLTDSIQHDPNTIEGTITWELFSRNIEYEKKTKDSESSHVVRMKLEEMEKIQKKIGAANTQKLFFEIITLIRASQQNDDYSTVQMPIIYFTLHNLDRKQAEEVVSRTLFLLHHLLRDNLQLKQAAIQYEILEFHAVHGVAVQDVNEPS